MSLRQRQELRDALVALARHGDETGVEAAEAERFGQTVKLDSASTFECIVDRDKQAAGRSPVLEPLVVRAVQLDQLTDAMPALPPSYASYVKFVRNQPPGRHDPVVWSR